MLIARVKMGIRAGSITLADTTRDPKWFDLEDWCDVEDSVLKDLLIQLKIIIDNKREGLA